MDETRLGRWVQAILRRRVPVLAAAALIVALGVALAVRLRLATDLAELLPTDDPAVVATKEIQARLGGVVPLQVAIASPSKAANLAFAEALTSALRHEPLVAHAAYEVHAERAFFERNWWLYLDPADLASMRELLTKHVQWRKNPLLVDLDDDDAELRALEARIRKRIPAAERFPEGNFMSADGTLVVIMVWPPGTMAREHGGEALVARVHALIDGLPHAGLRVELAGSIEDAIRERHALENDLAWASGLCLVLVSLVVVLFYGRLRALPLMAAPALCGIAVALGVGELAFGQLNTSTAFLGSIILGNGINAAIIQLARYEEERRGGASLEDALVRSVTGTIRATGIAALAASVAYASLMLTHFRGFSQFGLIGAVGMITAWLATIIVLPALIATIDRGRARVRLGIAFGAPFGVLAGRAPRAITAVALALSIGAAIALAGYVRDPFEYDLRHLRSVQTDERAELVARTEAIFGTFTPTILLARTPEQPAEIAAILRARGGDVLGEIITLDALLPGTPDAQRAKLETIDAIRRVVRDPLLPDSALAKLARWTPPDDLAVVTAATLPETMTRPLRDPAGELQPVVIAYRSKRISYWNGRDLIALAAVVRRVELRDGTVVHAGGNPVVFASMVEAIAQDGPLATLASFAAVALLVIALARGVRGAVVVLGALVTGVLWLAGAAALADVRVNFLNFIALPLTFGIGVDYAINIYLRYRAGGGIVETLRATGGAVVLCSLTTMIGYASLLLADSQALRSFGKLAILGELSCLSVAVLVMPAWLLLSQPRAPRTPGTRAPAPRAPR